MFIYCRHRHHRILVPHMLTDHFNCVNNHKHNCNWQGCGAPQRFSPAHYSAVARTRRDARQATQSTYLPPTNLLAGKEGWCREPQKTRFT